MIFNKQKLSYDKLQRSVGSRYRDVGYLDVRVKRKGINYWETICKQKHNLGTTVGQDLLHRVLYTNTGSDASGFGANQIALSTNAGGASAAHTAVAGEITGTGLARAVATTKTHTPGTNTTTIQHVFTASGTHTNVQLTGLFNNTAASGTPTGGILVHEATFTATTLASGDELQVTWTITSTF